MVVAQRSPLVQESDTEWLFFALKLASCTQHSLPRSPVLFENSALILHPLQASLRANILAGVYTTAQPELPYAREEL